MNTLNKTVVDAVCKYGSCNLRKFISVFEYVGTVHKYSYEKGGLAYMADHSVFSLHDWRLVCTAEEYNQCVDDMTQGTFVPLADKSVIDNINNSVNDTPEIQYDAAGNGYEINRWYEFSDEHFDGEGGYYTSALKSVDDRCNLQFQEGGGCSWRYCREWEVDVIKGKIHPPLVVSPVVDDTTSSEPMLTSEELIEGKAYQFDFNREEGGEITRDLIGIFHMEWKYGSDHPMLCNPVENSKCNADYARNIKLLK